VITAADLHGAAGNDTLTAGAGSDSLYAGAGKNVLNAGAGSDTLVSIGSSADTLVGGSGFDSFWVDNSSAEVIQNVSAAETSGGAVHKVASFMGFNSTVNGKTVSTAVSNQLNGGTLLEPAVTASGITYASFSADPLFSDAGPATTDIAQGQVGDCYFLSTLASMAYNDPNLIRQSVVSLGDGTFAVQFTGMGGAKTFVRVDGMLPVYSGGTQLAYDQLGAQHSLWGAVIEKAFAEFRGATADYNAIGGGWMSEVYSDFGVSSSSVWSATSASSLWTELQQFLAAGKSVTYACENAPAGANLVGDHAYMVSAVGVNAQGVQTVTLYNPWGMYVTVTAQQLLDGMWGVMTANV
jgi:hypothetical protein